MGRRLKISGGVAGGVILLGVLLVGAVLITANTGLGLAWIERLTLRLSGGTVKLAGLQGFFPTRLTLDELQVIDHDGVWLSAQRVSLTWSPWRLLEQRIQIDTLRAARVHMERTPVGDGKGGKASVPDIEVGGFSFPAVELGAPLVGTATTLSLLGNIRLRSLEDANANLVAHRLNGEGDYVLHIRFDPRRMDASLAVHEPAGGPLDNLLSLPGLGALAADATLHGPRNAEVLDVVLGAGQLQGRVQGSVDLVHQSAQLDYSLTAKAMAPRPDISWAGISLEGNWHGSMAAPTAAGRLQVDGLELAGTTRIAKLTANLAADRGKLGMGAVVSGLEIPGPQPKFLAKDPLSIHASLQLDAAARPLEFAASHPLFALRGHADTVQHTAGQLTALLELRVPELAPFAVFTGQDVRGSAVLSGRLVHRQNSDALGLDANLALTGGTAEWVPWVGPRVSVQLAGSLSDARIVIDNLRIAGRASTLTASAGAERTSAADAKPNAQRAFLKSLKARWQLDMANLASLSSDVGGDLHMSGRLSGSPSFLAADAEVTSRLSVRGSASGDVKASLHARGLPGAPTGSVQANGMLDGAPLDLDVAVDRDGAGTYRMQVRHAEWKSARVAGEITANRSFTQSQGQLAVHVAQLADFDRLLDIQLSGSVRGTGGFAPAAGRIEAQVNLDGTGLSLGQFAGDVHLKAQGVPDALALRLAAEFPNLYGAPATLAAAAQLNLDAGELKLAGASLSYRGETAKLLAPTRLSFVKGLTVDDLKVGLRESTFEIKGQAAPVLDLRASVQKISPQLVNVFSPGLLAAGTIEAHARLQGTLRSPKGSVGLDASDIRFADDAATGLPALAVHARAELAGDTASIDATLAAGSGSQLTASGTLPLAGAGAVDMKIGGKLDIGLANPFLEARGMRAAGQLQADATVTGTASAPLVGGGITLTQGSLRDFGRGVNLSDIAADVVGDAGGLQIKSFKATASSGSIAMSGTFGVLQPGWPVDLHITATNAQPIASNIVTANLDADVRVSGTARKHLDVAGKIHVHRATIGIPNSLPPDVAVLDVRRRGQAAQVDAQKQLVIGMDITIDAPQEILVQGRGLDAEMGGSIRLTGTSDVPLAAGGFDLQRGSFTLAGNKLTFTQGRVSFDGAGLRKKIDPTLDFTASTSLADTTATLRITGVADAPRFDFTSSPVLPQDEIMARLLFGQNAASLTGLQAAELGWALATLTGVGGGGSNPLVKLQKSLGLDRLSVGSNTKTTATGTENSEAAIQAGRYISKRVYIEGKQTTAGTSQVQVDVDLTKHLKLQTRLGNGTATTQGTTPENDPGSSVGLSYQFEY